MMRANDIAARGEAKMQYTTNRHLNLPEYTDTVDIEKINENFKVIDAHFKEFEDFLAMVVGGQITNDLATAGGDALTTAKGDQLVIVRNL